MPKGKSKSSKSNKSKKGKKGKNEKPFIPAFHIGCNTFQFENGDNYNGNYLALRNGQILRNTFGIYTTQSGEIYAGNWENDKLVHGEIIYTNGDKYNGSLLENQYSGPGCYDFTKDGATLSCSFGANRPVGSAILVDNEKKSWGGQSGKDKLILYKEHIFMAHLNKFGNEPQVLDENG